LCGILEVANLSLDEPELKRVVFGDDHGETNVEAGHIKVGSN